MRVICSLCGKVIKDDDGKGGWDSHGICLTCKDIYYPSRKEDPKSPARKAE